MDPFTQGVLGASLSQMPASDNEKKQSILIGFLAGMAPDLDILIRSTSDPLLAIEFHRHFTHSLIFAPVGALALAHIFYFVLKRKMSLIKIYLFSFLGIITHGVLDACTSYGTHLLWPFTLERTSWSVISIVDPFFTLPLFLLVLLRLFKVKKVFKFFPPLFAVLYICSGQLIKLKVSSDYKKYAEIKRGHKSLTSYLKPSVGGLFLWRGIYTHNGSYYVDALHFNLFQKSKLYEGSTVPTLKTEDIKGVKANSVLYKDIERFSYFSDGFIFWTPLNKTLGDLRYSLIPNDIEPLWGIDVNLSKQNEHAPFLHLRTLNEDKIKRFKEMYLGRD